MIFVSSMYCVIIFGVALVLPLWHNLYKSSKTLYNIKIKGAVNKLPTLIEDGARVLDSTCCRVQVVTINFPLLQRAQTGSGDQKISSSIGTGG
jgi:fumarate reductase subunit D